jgi:putative tricarboxylic transport membrane protein
MAARREIAFSICMVALSSFLTFQSFRYPADSAFFPRVLSLLLLLLSLLLLTRAFRQSPREGRTGGTRGNAFSLINNQPILVFGSTTLYVVMIPILGFLVSTALFIFGSIVFRDRRRLVVAAIYGVCFSAALYFAFHAVLGVTLPRGWLL